MNSPADGKTNSFLACAKIGAVGIVASTAGDHSHTFDINAGVTIPELYTTTHSGHTHTI